MRKIRIYLDTSVISMIDSPHAPEIEAITKEFFQILIERSDEFQACSSPVGTAEIDESPPQKKMLFQELLRDLNCVYIPESDETKNLTKKYIQAGFLTQKHVNDITHLAYAVTVQCDYVVSWNMKHLVRERTTSGVRVVNEYNNYHTPFIVTPEFFIEEHTDDHQSTSR